MVAEYFKAPPPRAYTATVKKGPKWVAAKDKENVQAITKFIRSFCPVGPVVSLDEIQGRWRIVSQNLDWKSISWTKRGYEKAACMTIHQAWAFHHYCAGEKSPFDLKALEARFQETVPVA